jgi:zinc protease
MDMALSILGQGLSSRLNQNVREKLQLGQDLSAGMFNGKSPGLVYLWADLEPGQVKDCLKAMWAEAERMKREEVSTEELARQMLRIEHEEASERMSMEGMAGKLGYYESLGDYRLSDKVTQKMRAVTAKDILRVMNKYFKVEQASLVIYRPEKSKPIGLESAGWQALLEGAVPSTEAAAPQAKAAGKNLKQIDFQNGLKLIVRPIRHTPLVAFQAVFPGGSKADPDGKAGASNMLARLLLKGAPGMDAAAIAARLDDLGASLSPYADFERFTLAGQTLSSKFEEVLELAGDVLRHATLPSDELEKERERVLKAIKDKSDQADDYVGDLFNALFFKGSHFEEPVEGTAKSVKALDREDLLELQKQTLVPNGMLLVITGDLDPEKARRTVEKVFGPERWASAKPASLPKIKEVQAKSQQNAEKLNKKQAHIMLGWPCPKPTDSDYYACRILNNVMGEGMDSRLFVEVRDKRALCYTVQSFMDRREDPGAWRVYVGTQPENEKKATEVVLEVAKDLAEKGVTAEELESAKAYAKGIFKVARQDFSTEARLLANYEFWGLGAAQIDDIDARFDAVSLDQVQAAAKKYLLTDKTTIAVVRP